MTLRRNPDPDQTADGQPPEAETLMRRALGLLPSGGPQPRTRGGDGPVIVERRGDRQAGPSVNRVAAAEAALAEERYAREQLTRQLREAENALREAQTKRGHAELARDELQAALIIERGAREAAEEQVRQLSATAQVHLAEPSAPLAPARAARGPAAAKTEPVAAAKRRGRPPGSGSKASRAATKTPQPDNDDSEAVEWWVPGWQDRI